jgi:hypothetical protein
MRNSARIRISNSRQAGSSASLTAIEKLQKREADMTKTRLPGRTPANKQFRQWIPATEVEGEDVIMPWKSTVK